MRDKETKENLINAEKPNKCAQCVKELSYLWRYCILLFCISELCPAEPNIYKLVSLLFYKMNFETIEKSLRESVKGWSWRGLTLLGRIQVIKSFAIPKILYRASLISTKKDFIKKINYLLYSFVWKGKDKVKWNALINSLEKGGLKMPDFESMIKTQRVLCIKKFLETSSAVGNFSCSLTSKR